MADQIRRTGGKRFAVIYRDQAVIFGEDEAILNLGPLTGSPGRRTALIVPRKQVITLYREIAIEDWTARWVTDWEADHG